VCVLDWRKAPFVIGDMALYFLPYSLQVTGPASSPEYMTHIPKASEYRKHGPASVPEKVMIPHAEDENIYNIRYYTRDSRRESVKTTTRQFDPKAERFNAWEEIEAAQKKVRKFTRRSILDVDNNGYTL
jgi:hypothetical protein